MVQEGVERLGKIDLSRIAIFPGHIPCLFDVIFLGRRMVLNGLFR